MIIDKDHKLYEKMIKHWEDSGKAQRFQIGQETWIVTETPPKFIRTSENINWESYSSAFKL